jgi:tetratricopeptide (TPR) repeat protein
MYGRSDAEACVNRGLDAFWQFKFDEAEKDFEQAVRIDPGSVQAHLSLGVLNLVQYGNRVSETRQQIWDPEIVSSRPDADNAAAVDRARKLIDEHGAKIGRRAEESLTEALRLDPRNTLAMEYLAALCYNWLDSNEHRSRLDDAERWIQRSLDINPEHKFANYCCGAINAEKVLSILQGTGYPLHRVLDEGARQLLHAKITPLLSESARNFGRALEIDSKNVSAMTYVSQMKIAEGFVAETPEEWLQARREADEWNRRACEVDEENARAEGQPWPRTTATVTFYPMSEDEKAKQHATRPLFPFDPSWMLPRAPPPMPGWSFENWTVSKDL